MNYAEFKYQSEFLVWLTIYGKKKKRNHLPSWDKVKIIDGEPLCKRRRIKEAAHMLGHVGPH